MSSQRRIDASRANGAKSRGPVTPEGKARSSRNAAKHGLASPSPRTVESVCLSNENTADLEQLHQSLIDEFSPATTTEALLVEEMAVARFRMQRAWEHEAALMDHEMETLRTRRAGAMHPVVITDPATESALAFASLEDNGRGLDAIHRYEARLSRQFDRALRRLRELRAEPLAAEGEPQVTPLPNEPSPKSEHPPASPQPLSNSTLPAPQPPPPQQQPADSTVIPLPDAA